MFNVKLKNVLASYIIHEKNLKEAILKEKPSLWICYENDFRFQDEWLSPFIQKEGEFILL